MANPFLGEIKIVGFNFAPRGFALCNGQLLPINQNQALFSLLGTFYGGNGTTTFALPNLQGRAPVHSGTGPVTVTQGETGGEATHTLLSAEMPLHTHTPSGASAATTGNPTNATWAAGSNNFTSAPNVAMSAAAIGSAGGNQAHENRSPFLALLFCIALQGIFPSRS